MGKRESQFLLTTFQKHAFWLLLRTFFKNWNFSCFYAHSKNVIFNWFSAHFFQNKLVITFTHSSLNGNFDTLCEHSPQLHPYKCSANPTLAIDNDSGINEIGIDSNFVAFRWMKVFNVIWKPIWKPIFHQLCRTVLQKLDPLHCELCLHINTEKLIYFNFPTFLTNLYSGNFDGHFKQK